MKIITAPNKYKKPVHIFLAGGISDCPLWQNEALELFEQFSDGLDLVIFNPRRENWDMSDTNAAEQQIKWEHDFLGAADAHFFWFPKATLCPITLFELGKVAPLGKPLSVGCEPGYLRRFDVETQLWLLRKDMFIASNLGTAVKRLIASLRH